MAKKSAHGSAVATFRGPIEEVDRVDWMHPGAPDIKGTSTFEYVVMSDGIILHQWRRDGKLDGSAKVFSSKFKGDPGRATAYFQSQPDGFTRI